jgi:uncharacterized membrane protein YbhN (UPF0104 family)
MSRPGWFSRSWPWLRRILTIGFFGLVAWLIVSQARSIDWTEVGGALRSYSVTTLLAAVALAMSSHLVYSTYDLLGRAWTGHRLPARQVMPITFVSYAFNLNFGSLIGGFAFRYRLYSRYGLESETVTRVLTMSMVSNWLGYLLLAGAVAALGIVEPPSEWKIGALGIRISGFVMIALALAYLAVCAFARRRDWTLRNHHFTLPPFRLAVLQFVVSCANWLLMASVLYVLFQQKLPYPVVLGALLTAAVAGAVAHVPAGLGVIEAVFIGLLSGYLPTTQILAALLAYRAVYYLLPLVLALAVYVALEMRGRKSDALMQQGRHTCAQYRAESD